MSDHEPHIQITDHNLKPFSHFFLLFLLQSSGAPRTTLLVGSQTELVRFSYDSFHRSVHGYMEDSNILHYTGMNMMLHLQYDRRGWGNCHKVTFEASRLKEIGWRQWMLKKRRFFWRTNLSLRMLNDDSPVYDFPLRVGGAPHSAAQKRSWSHSPQNEFLRMIGEIIPILLISTEKRIRKGMHHTSYLTAKQFGCQVMTSHQRTKCKMVNRTNRS